MSADDELSVETHREQYVLRLRCSVQLSTYSLAAGRFS